MLVSGFFFAAAGVFVKLGTQWYDAAELAFYRSLFSFFAVAVVVIARGGGGQLWPGPSIGMHVIRGTMGALPYDEPDLWVDVGQLDGSAYTSVTRDHYKDIIALRAADIAQRRGQGGRP